MTTLTAPAPTALATIDHERRLRTVLLEDGVVTAAVGAAVVALAGPLAEQLPGSRPP
jgi:hypothetical protein